MSDLDGFRGYAAQARRLARCTADRRMRTNLEILSEELEQQIDNIERRRAIDAEGCAGLRRGIEGPRA